MKIIKSEQILFTDVDDTLLIWDAKVPPGQKSIVVWCPYEKVWLEAYAHLPHIRLLKERKARGAYIIALSAGGYQWTRNVIIALELQNIIDEVMSKPILILDDLKTEKALGKTTYLKPTSRWKAHNGR